jgi:hypothetical protein
MGFLLYTSYVVGLRDYITYKKNVFIFGNFFLFKTTEKRKHIIYYGTEEIIANLSIALHLYL